MGEEAGDLLSKAIINAFVRIKPTDPALLDGIGTLHDVRRWIESDAVGDKVLVIPLGDLYAGETRELLVHFSVPALAALGHHQLAEFTIDYVTLPDLVAQTITWPMAVNVVPGDEASGRVPDPTVTTARLLAEATRAKKEATEALGHGDADSAARLMTEQSGRLQAAIPRIADSMPNAAELRSRLAEEREQLEKLARGAREQDAFQLRKSFVEDVAMESRGRNDQVRRNRARSKRDF